MVNIRQSITIAPIGNDDTPRLQELLDRAGSSLHSFRYFNKRPLTIINQHLLTVLSYDQDRPCGYGHLDKEQDKVWLGVMVAEDYQGMGIGKMILNYLFDFADRNNVSEIFLTVDKVNYVAEKLYRTFGFVEEPIGSTDTYTMMKRIANGNIH